MDVTIEDDVNGVIEDNVIVSSTPTLNYGTGANGTANNYFGGIITAGQWSLIKVDLSVHAGTIPVSGKFMVRPSLYNVSTMPGKCTKLLKAFVEATSTWNNRDTGTPWDLPGAQEDTGGTPDRHSSDECTFDMLNSGTTDIPITVPTLTGWVDGTNYGVVTSGNGGVGGQYVHWGSAENVTVPIQFYYEYTEAAGLGTGTLRSRIINFGGV